MTKLANAKEFAKIQAQFETAMAAVETQTDQIDNFMEMSQETFYNAGKDKTGKMSDEDFEKFIEEQAGMDGLSDESIEKEINELKKKIESENE